MKLRGVSWAPEPGATPILSGLDLELPDGQVTALVGRSGCGKSSLLRLLAGLRAPTAGTITGVPDRKAFVFQDAALLPWLSLRENVALPGRFGPIGDVDAAIERVGLTAHAEKLPGALSGGQRMRASLARALVSRPALVLLDEAFSALDGMTRRAVQRAFLELREEAGWTVILVTHELEDAVYLSDRVIAVDGPPLRVLGTVEVDLPRPRNPHDAALTGPVDTLDRLLGAGG